MGWWRLTFAAKYFDAKWHLRHKLFSQSWLGLRCVFFWFVCFWVVACFFFLVVMFFFVFFFYHFFVHVVYFAEKVKEKQDGTG